MAATTKHHTQASAHTEKAGTPNARSAEEIATSDERSGIAALYPAGHRPVRRRGYIDDTLDAHPPLHLYSGDPTPEQIEAAKRLVQERGLLPRAAAKARQATSATQADKTSRQRRQKRVAESKQPAHK